MGVFSDCLTSKIKSSAILVVGAGGIGCEILKNLVLCGFNKIEIIDLDTIDVSNLNRQFLFHKEHVGKRKSEVARESALIFNPKANIVAHYDSITSTKYGVNYFQRFDIVLNALDNRAARNHVNRMCLTAGVPLIESGTAGYNGQVELIKKGVTQCYECTPKAAQKTYPGCTIRNTPSEPIHCIVWAKHLFNQLFGEDNADEDVSPDTADPEAASNAGANALTTKSNEKGNVERQSTRLWAQSCEYNVEKLFNKLFFDDLNYLLSMSNLWKTRKPPIPLKYGDFSVPGCSATDSEDGSVLLRDQRVWTLTECAKVFDRSVNALKDECKQREGESLVWDKDDEHSMNFVASCANIRAHVFHIQKKSRFEMKSMAGNIIPAIATTNAITAGVVVINAFKVLQEAYEQCPNVYMRLRPNARNQIIISDKSLNPPNPKCYVCSSKPEVVVKVDTENMTIQEFRDEVLIKSLNTIDPDVIIDGKGIIVISSEEGETEQNNSKMLKEMSIVDGCVLKVDDFHQNYELSIIILHKASAYDETKFEVIIADPDQLRPEKLPTDIAATTQKRNSEHNDEDDDDLVMVVEELESTEERSQVKLLKRKSEEPQSSSATDEAPAYKKSKMASINEDDNDIIQID